MDIGIGVPQKRSQTAAGLTTNHLVGNYREAQRSYRKEVPKAYKETWRTFCSSVNLLRSARLHGALTRDTKTRLGTLAAPTGDRTQSEGETLDLLLATHFPNSTVVEGGCDTSSCLPRHTCELAGGCKDYCIPQGGVGD